MNFFTKYGGITTHTPWKRPTSKVIREWRDELSFDLTDWFVVGNGDGWFGGVKGGS